VYSSLVLIRVHSYQPKLTIPRFIHFRFKFTKFSLLFLFTYTLNSLVRVSRRVERSGCLRSPEGFPVSESRDEKASGQPQPAKHT